MPTSSSLLTFTYQTSKFFRVIFLCLLQVIFLGCGGLGVGETNNNDNKASYCGDGVLDPGEQCDDGSSNSEVEPDACRTDCRNARCGDYVADTDEDCDRSDLNGQDCWDVGDYNRGVLACTSSCAFDTSECGSCGNGTAEGETPGDPHYETCDGSDLRGQDCISIGQAQGVLACNGCEWDISGCTGSGSECGNGILEGEEQCDDGGVVACDGCSPTCIIESCGNGVVECGESCDDGGQLAGDGCGPTCLTEVCGNGYLDPGESCDDGAANSDMVPNACRTNCTLPACGDGVVDTGEDCEGGDLGGADCSTLGYDGGTLACHSTCEFDPWSCTAVPEVFGSTIAPWQIALDTTHVYLISNNAFGDDTVQKKAKSGGSWTTLATDTIYNFNSMAIDATHVYWGSTQSGYIWKVDKNGGGSTQLVGPPGGNMQSTAVDSANVFFIEANVGLQTMATGGGSPTVLSTDVGTSLNPLAIDSTTVYWPYGSDILSISKMGAPSSTVITTSTESSPLYSIAVDGTHIYWLEGTNGRVMKVPKGGGVQVTLASNLTQPYSIAVDNDAVYWGDQTDGTIMKVRKSGSLPIPIALIPGQATSIKVDDTHVYWVDYVTEEVLRVLK